MMDKAQGSGNLLWSPRTSIITAQSHTYGARRVLPVNKPQVVNSSPQVIMPGASIPLVLPGQML